MPRLLIARHAKSSWKDESLDDHDRPLKKRGLRDAPQMAELLAAEGVHVERLISSSAARARETARRLAPGLGLPPDAVEIRRGLYTFDPRAALALIRSLDLGEQSVAIVGHNPAMHELVELLTGETIDAFPTSAVALLELSELTPGGGELLRLWTPKGDLRHYRPD